MLGAEMRRRSAPCIRGDLFNLGSDWYGEDQASSVIDPAWGIGSLQTWQNNGSVMNRVEYSRRREELTYSHFAEVAYLAPDQFANPRAKRGQSMLSAEQLQDHYMEVAIENSLSVRKLRELIKADKGEIDVSFNVRPLNERASGMAQKVGAIIDEVEQDLPTLGKDAVEYLFTAHDSLDAAADELARVLKKAGKKEAEERKAA
jgi:hypothetical protein